MIAALERFLSAADLGVAAHALDDVTDISREDAAALIDVVVAWAPEQAIANMLLHPAIIPPAYRVSAMLRGLATDFRQYPLVAAIVGLRQHDLPGEYSRAVAQRLVDLCATKAEPVSSLASVGLARYLLHIDTGDVLSRFRQFGETARHNALVGLIDALGAADLRTHVDLARRKGTIGDEIADEIDDRLDAIAAEAGGMILMAEIPTLSAWNARPSPAPYGGA